MSIVNGRVKPAVVPPRHAILLCRMASSAAVVLLGFGHLWASPADDFYREYPIAAGRLEEAYSHVKILCTSVRHSRDDNALLWEERVQCLRNGPLVMIVRHVVRSAASDWGPGATAAFGGDSRVCLSMHKQPGDERFTVDEFGPNPEVMLAAAMKGRPAFAAYCVLDARVVDLLKREKLLGVTRTKLDGNEAIEVAAEFVASNGKAKLDRFYFEPHSWALLGWTVLRGPLAMQSRITYDNPGDVVPRIRTITYWEESPAGSLVEVGVWQFDVASIEFGPISDKEFELATFGASPGSLLNSAESAAPNVVRPSTLALSPPAALIGESEMQNSVGAAPPDETNAQQPRSASPFRLSREIILSACGVLLAGMILLAAFSWRERLRRRR